MPILAAGNKPRLHGRGFTLLETLVVLVILGLALTLVVPAVSRGLGNSLDDVVRQLHTGLRQARSEAVNQQRSVLFVLDVNKHSFRAGGRAARSIPEEFSLHARTAQRERHEGSVGIRFYPDGSATGGRIGVGESGQRVWLEVDWLTGRISRVEE